MKGVGVGKDSEKLQSLYDKEYFEDGIVTGKSCYQNYQWLPELTIKMAHNLIKYLSVKDGEKILDYGCAKGYLVKALRVLDVEAYGCDISEYAMHTIDTDVRDYCRLLPASGELPFDMTFDWIVSKDVMEHMSEEQIDSFLTQAAGASRKMFHIIPLGDNGVFRVSSYHEDPSHIQIQDEDWWMKRFEACGWKVTSFEFIVKGIKEKWTQRYPKGNGFFVLEKK